MCAAKLDWRANLQLPQAAPVISTNTMHFFSVIRLVGLMTALCAWTTLTRAESVRSNRDFDFYISPLGDDLWSGRSLEPNAARTDGPFASLEKAKSEVRNARSNAPKA